MIPLDQGCPDDTEFSFAFVNQSDEDQYATTSHIYSSDGKKYFYDNMTIALMEPGEYIAIENIYVESGYNYQHSKFSISSDIIWNHTDYVDVEVMEQKSIKVIRMYRGDIEPLFKKHGISTDDVFKFGSDIVFDNQSRKRVLVVPDPTLEQFHDMDFLKQVYDEIIEIATTVSADRENQESKIVHVQSTMSNPREFECEFTTNGNVDPVVVVQSYFDDTIDILLGIKSDTNASLTETGEIGEVIINEIGEVSLITIIGHTYTISEMLRQYIFAQDPTIPFLATNIAHPDDRAFVIKMIHREPYKLLFNAIDALVRDLQDLRAQL